MGLMERLRDFLVQCGRTLRLAVKPGRSELWISIKICFLGIAAVGLIGFVIKVIAAFLNPGVGGTTGA